MNDNLAFHCWRCWMIIQHSSLKRLDQSVTFLIGTDGLLNIHLKFPSTLHPCFVHNVPLGYWWSLFLVFIEQVLTSTWCMRGSNANNDWSVLQSDFWPWAISLWTFSSLAFFLFILVWISGQSDPSNCFRDLLWTCIEPLSLRWGHKSCFEMPPCELFVLFHSPL